MQSIIRRWVRSSSGRRCACGDLPVGRVGLLKLCTFVVRREAHSALILILSFLASSPGSKSRKRPKTLRAAQMIEGTCVIIISLPGRGILNVVVQLRQNRGQLSLQRGPVYSSCNEMRYTVLALRVSKVQ